ncbi:MAG: DUF1587 domain-containing protein, partial [Pirellulaceae bacterium]|nr:DUF1587 domain-containing protein [Pirellulaceae bacterium]
MKPLWLRIVCGLVPLLMFGLAGLNGYTYAADDGDQTVSPSALIDSRKTFEQHVQPLLAKHCVGCHNVDQVTSGVRVDHVSEWATAQDERYLRLWEGIRHQLVKGSMPPKEEPQPAQDQLRATVAWIENLVQVARSRPSPKNGSTRRLTVAQYRNTLRDLIGIDEDLAKTLPPDAVSRDGFLNNAETLQLSPLLLEAYFQIAGEALDRVLVDPQTKPTIQNFRVELGRAINASPYAETLILGANNHLLRNEDFVVRELVPSKPFAFEPFHMQTKFRFIEGYAGNDTVRGWREYDSIYHAVFACMRGSEGYPKGDAYNTVKDGLLLRPAIPSAEEFQVESTYGPKANFKISLRELPSHGRFRVTVKAARYNDGLLLEPSDRLKPNDRLSANGEGPAQVQPSIICQRAEAGQDGVNKEVDVPQAGIYRVDVFQESADQESIKPDASRLSDMLIGAWPSYPDSNLSDEPDLSGRLMGESRLVDSPIGKAVSFDGQEDALVVPRHANMDVGTGDFTVSAWIRPRGLKQAGLVCLGKYNWTHGWYLDMPDNRGTLRIESAGPDSTSNGSVSSPAGAIVAGVWQHVTAVVRRGENSTRLFVNGYPIAKGSIGPANLDNPKVDLHIGRIQAAQEFRGEMAEVRIYRRALDEAEIQALLASGRQFIKPPRQQPHDLLLSLGDRDFSNKLRQPAFLAVRLPAGSLAIKTQYAAAQRIERVKLTRLDEDDAIAKRFTEFERRSPTLGVYLGLRRDCGSTLSRVGQ